MRKLGKTALAVAVATAAPLLGIVAAAPSASATTGTLTITGSTTLSEDHYGSIVIGADDVTLDCAGHQVIYPGTNPGGPGGGILLVGRTGVTVENCHVTGAYQYPVAVMQGSSGNTLRDNTATGYIRNGFSLVDGADNNTLTGNVATGGLHGFWVVDASGNVLADNQSYDSGFQLGNGPGTTTTNNTLVNNTSSGSIHASFSVFGANGNTVTNNTATHNGVAGFSAMVASGNTFRHDAATYNGIGFDVVDGTGNTFTKDAANHNAQIGFMIYPESTGNVVAGSQAHNNGFSDAADDTSPSTNTWTNDNFGTMNPAGLGSS